MSQDNNNNSTSPLDTPAPPPKTTELKNTTEIKVIKGSTDES